jgi:TPR repeat protein
MFLVATPTMSTDETKVSRVRVTATFEDVSPLDYAEIAWRFGVTALTSGDPTGTRTVFRAHRLCLEEERAHAALKAENYQEAARLFEPLAERGSEWAHAILGWMHLYGHLGPPDVAKAIVALEKAATPGYGDAKYYLGLALLKKGDRDRAETVFRDGAAENDARCTSELMRLEETRAWEALEAGNDEEAARLFEPLVARGSTYAMVHLGRMYERGAQGAPDLQKAMSLWEEAARLGSVYAKYTMARSLRRTGDKARARALFLEGAEQGDKPCTYWAGRMLVRREGGDADRAAGVALLTRAADRGHLYAQSELLRLDLKEAPTVLARLRVRGRILGHALTFIRRALREPDIFDSDDVC